MSDSDPDAIRAPSRTPPTIQASLVISGEIDPRDVATRMGIQPTALWRVGEWRTPLKVWDRSGLRLSFPETSTWNLGVVLAATIRGLRGLEDELASLSRRSVDCLIYVTVVAPDAAPEISLTPEDLGWLSTAGLRLDIDFLVPIGGSTSERSV